MYIAARDLFKIIFFVSEIIIQEKGSKLLKDVTDNNTKGRYIFLLSMIFGKRTCIMVSKHIAVNSFQLLKDNLW